MEAESLIIENVGLVSAGKGSLLQLLVLKAAAHLRRADVDIHIVLRCVIPAVGLWILWEWLPTSGGYHGCFGM